jgi:peptidoglycan/LPS O-acetylase OafA/YrhL
MKYQSIQLLRALAAIMVVVQHSHIAFAPADKARLWWWPGFSDFGWLGVSFFFVISGFIIANVLSRPNFSYTDYFWRRFIRIYPLYWIVGAVGWYYYLTRNWFNYGVDSLGVEGMMKSFLIFPLKAHPFWEPGWSLEHEVIFYLIAAGMVPIFGLLRLAIVLIALGVTGMLVHFDWDYHILDEAQIFFGAGVVAYLLKGRVWLEALPVALCSLALAYAQYYGLFSLGTILPSVTYAIGVAALIIALIDMERHGWKVPHFLVLIGSASFSLYLWHWLIIPVVSRWKDVGGEPELWRWVIVATSVLAALASYLLIEKPLISFSHRYGRRKINRGDEYPA